MLFSLYIFAAGLLWSGLVAAAPAGMLVGDGGGMFSQQKAMSLGGAPVRVETDGRKVLQAWVRRTCSTCSDTNDDECDLGGLHTTPAAFDSRRTRGSTAPRPGDDEEACITRIQKAITAAIQGRVAEAAAGRVEVAAAVADLTYLAYIRQRLDELFLVGPPSRLRGRDSAVRYVRQVSDTARLFQLYRQAQPQGSRGDEEEAEEEKQSTLAWEMEWLRHGGSSRRASSSSEWSTFAAHTGLAWHQLYRDPASPGRWLRFDKLAASLETALGDDHDPQQCPTARTEWAGLASRILHTCTRGLPWLRDLAFRNSIPPEVADGYNIARLLAVGPGTDLAAAFEYFMHGGAGGRYFALFKRCPGLERSQAELI